jgi:hypothetical protein
MRWRAIGAPGDPYPKWLRDVQRSSGVYAIRRVGLLFTTVLYVGESHTGNLYKTLTRHFQEWHRGKHFWFGQYAPAQTDPGHTYDRTDCEVAIKTCAKTAAIALQSKWIARLKPRDNHAGVVELEEAPF